MLAVRYGLHERLRVEKQNRSRDPNPSERKARTIAGVLVMMSWDDRKRSANVCHPWAILLALNDDHHRPKN